MAICCCCQTFVIATKYSDFDIASFCVVYYCNKLFVNMTEFSSEIILKNESFINENSNLDWQDENLIDSSEIQRKCGEIILLANTKLWFVCTFCDERFHNIIIFRNHIRGIHIIDADNVIYTEDENPLAVPPNENQHIIKFETDGRHGNCDDNMPEVSNNSISNPNSNQSSKEFKLESEKAILEIDELGETTSIQNNEMETNAENHETIQPISEAVNEIICEDSEEPLIAPKKIPKKRNRKKKVYSCPTCEHIARDKKSLEAHLQSNHGTGTRHQCEECGKCFRNGNNLKCHLVIHSGTRPFKCDSCDSDFSHYTSLKTHRYIHTGERPHKCNQCDKGFVSSSGLKTHLREHSGEIPYVCQFCERGFTTKFTYKKHMISHSGRRAHECPQCKKGFLRKETLTEHMVCHSDEKKFFCSICSKKFTHKKNLVQHEKLHSNIKQYICQICSKDFAQYAGLYSHMKHHNKNSK